MTRYAFAFLLILPALHAQDVPPPPKPADDGPSLADTMKFIEEKLGSSGRVNYIAYIHDNKIGNDFTLKFSDDETNVRASAPGCSIAGHTRYVRDEQVLEDEDYGFGLKDVQEVAGVTGEQFLRENNAKEGHPEWTARVDPPVFALVIKFKNIGYIFNLYDESLANRIAKAIVHAVELCGGGSKEPF